MGMNWSGENAQQENQPMNDLRICKDEAEVVRLMFEKAMREGLGPLRIANYLNDCGYTTRKGKRWNQSTIGRILSNRIYLGILQKVMRSPNSFRNFRSWTMICFPVCRRFEQIAEKEYQKI